MTELGLIITELPIFIIALTLTCYWGFIFWYKISVCLTSIFSDSTWWWGGPKAHLIWCSFTLTLKRLSYWIQVIKQGIPHNVVRPINEQATNVLRAKLRNIYTFGWNPNLRLVSRWWKFANIFGMAEFFQVIRFQNHIFLYIKTKSVVTYVVINRLGTTLAVLCTHSARPISLNFGVSALSPKMFYPPNLFQLKCIYIMYFSRSGALSHIVRPVKYCHSTTLLI